MEQFKLVETDAARAIARDASALGIGPGDTLLVHSSLKSLGGGVTPEEVVAGLFLALGPEGTLAMPTLSYLTCGPSSPRFDAVATPSCVGAVTEWFRVQPGALRSLCPTHSCAAVGPLAGALLGEHHLDGTPCGPRSPFARLRDMGGKVLFLGCGTRCNTSMHAVEELVLPPYLFGPEVEYEITDGGGQTFRSHCRAHDFRGVAQRYDRVPAMMDRGVRRGRILSAECVLLEAAPMWEAALDALRRDPCALVERII